MFGKSSNKYEYESSIPVYSDGPTFKDDFLNDRNLDKAGKFLLNRADSLLFSSKGQQKSFRMKSLFITSELLGNNRNKYFETSIRQQLRPYVDDKLYIIVIESNEVKAGKIKEYDLVYDVIYNENCANENYLKYESFKTKLLNQHVAVVTELSNAIRNKARVFTGKPECGVEYSYGSSPDVNIGLNGVSFWVSDPIWKHKDNNIFIPYSDYGMGNLQDNSQCYALASTISDIISKEDGIHADILSDNSPSITMWVDNKPKELENTLTEW